MPFIHFSSVIERCFHVKENNNLISPTLKNMGNYFWSSVPTGPGMKSTDFSSTECPATAAVFLLKLHQHTPGESCSDQLKELREHWIVVIDLDRKSTDSDIVGLELHLLRQTLDSNVMVLAPGPMLGRFQRSRLAEKYTHVGNIENIGGETSRRWALSLCDMAMDTFTLMSDQGDEWGAKVNCQQFAKKFLHDLSLSFTESACGDSNATLVDCYCTLDMWMRNCK